VHQAEVALLVEVIGLRRLKFIPEVALDAVLKGDQGGAGHDCGLLLLGGAALPLFRKGGEDQRAFEV